MIKVGIDTLAIYTSQYALSLATLAKARGIDPEKYHKGLGQYFMSFPPPGEDIVTMAANACEEILTTIDSKDIAWLLFATESAIDQSKAAGLYIHKLLNLPSSCRILELKQACYSGTAGLQLALPFLRENPDKKIVLIASDIARYGLNTSGESSQGCGAVAMILSAHPRLLALEPEYGVMACDVMDFWRPNYSHNALVDGKYSSKLYLNMLEKTWEEYKLKSKRSLKDHHYFCYHTPIPRLVEKAHQHLLKIDGQNTDEAIHAKSIQAALEYGRQLGNSYSAALYISLASLFDKTNEDLTDKRIGFYSYGSGCVAEYFSGIVQPDYKSALHTKYHDNLFSKRIFLSYADYESFYNFKYVEDGSSQDIPEYRTGAFRLVKMEEHKRIYEKSLTKSLDVIHENNTFKTIDLKHHRKEKINLGSSNYLTKVLAPGKLILSGEHSVLYGKPALAMAINRYVTATVTKESVPQVLFDLSDLAHHSQLSFDALRHLKKRIKQKYYRFIQGHFSIKEVLQKPFELAQFTLGVLADALNISLPFGVKLHLQSDIPIGCGLGSSAATILSVIQAVSSYLEIPLSKETLFKLALEAENMQHGRSSGLDLQIAMKGGCLFMEGDIVHERNVPHDEDLYLVNTGKPLSTTGQCVEKVAPHFKSVALQEEFASVTYAMDEALKINSKQYLKNNIQKNHQLLVKIGVVPNRVQQFITHIESLGGAAKICGAGAVFGEQAGALLVMVNNINVLTSISTKYGYSVLPIASETRGVHAA